MKKSNKGPEYSREREWGVLLEDLHGQFKVFGRGLNDIRERVIHLENDMSQLKSDVSLIKTAFRPLAGRVTALEARCRHDYII